MTQSGTSHESSGLAWQRLQPRLRELEELLSRLLKAPTLRFDEGIRNALPEVHGIYRIFDPREPQETIRAGRTNTAARGLRQRVYQNHLMGNQKGNLRTQLVAGGACIDLDGAKKLIRERFAVQVLAVEDEGERARLEHFMLAVLRPRYCD